MMKRLLSAALSFVLIALVLTSCASRRIIDQFKFEEIKDADRYGKYAPMVDFGAPMQLQEIETECKADGFDENGNLIDPDNFPEGEGITAGLIAIVKPKGSRNILLAEQPNSKEWAYISPNEVYPEASLDPSGIRIGASHVLTEVEIVKVLYQTELTNFSAGDSAKMKEHYYIADQRVPKVLDELKGGEYCINNTLYGYHTPWIPLECGETYLLFSRYTIRSAEGAPINSQDTIRPYHFGIFCLSDPSKQAGLLKDEIILQESVEYYQKHYGDQLN